MPRRLIAARDRWIGKILSQDAVVMIGRLIKNQLETRGAEIDRASLCRRAEKAQIV